MLLQVVASSLPSTVQQRLHGFTTRESRVGPKSSPHPDRCMFVVFWLWCTKKSNRLH